MKRFLIPVPRQNPRIRLVCLAHAGGAAATFRTWGAGLPEEIEVWAFELPGRGWRLGQEPIPDLGRMADEVAAAILQDSRGPLAVFGHSMGAWLGLEVARRLEGMGIQPCTLFASGRQAPVIGHTHPPIGHLNDDAFVEAVVKRYEGIPSEILANRDLLMLFLPALRADFVALEGYNPSNVTPVGTPIVAMVGDSDPLVPRDHLLPWAEATRGSFRTRVFPGGHFYFAPDPARLLREVEVELRRLLEEETRPGLNDRDRTAQ